MYWKYTHLVGILFVLFLGTRCSNENELLSGPLEVEQEETQFGLEVYPVRPEYHVKGIGSKDTLVWNRPRVGEGATYQVALDTLWPPRTIVAEGITDTFLSVEGLASASVYYWQVIADMRDGGARDSGRIWLFVTDFSSSSHLDLSGGRATQLLRDGDYLWVGMVNGSFHKIAINGEVRIANQYSAGASEISSIQKSDGKLWLGTNSDGLFVVNSDGTKKHISDTLADLTSIVDIDWDDEKTAWIISNGRIVKMVDDTTFRTCETDVGRYESFLRTNSFEVGGAFSNFVVGGDGGIFSSTGMSCAVTRIDTIEKLINYTLIDSVNGTSIDTTKDTTVFDTVTVDMLPDWSSIVLGDNHVTLLESGVETGTVWAATEYRVVKIVNGTISEEYVIFEGSNSPHKVTCLCPTSNGLWVGTIGGGITHIDSRGSKKQLNTGTSTLPSNNVYCIEKGLADKLYVGTDAGLFMFSQ